MAKALRKGSKVEWASQSGGFTKVKSGIIIATVPAGKNPMDYLPNYMECNSHTGYGAPRKHKSYLVRVGMSFKAYWPLVSRLNKPVTAKDRIKKKAIRRFDPVPPLGQLMYCQNGKYMFYDDHKAVVRGLMNEIERLQK